MKTLPVVTKLATDLKSVGRTLQFADALLGLLFQPKQLKRVKPPKTRLAFRHNDVPLPPPPKRPKPVRRYRKTSPYWKKLAARKARRG